MLIYSVASNSRLIYLCLGYHFCVWDSFSTVLLSNKVELKACRLIDNPVVTSFHAQ